MARPRPRAFFDTNVLSRDWSLPTPPTTTDEARQRAKALISLHRTSFTVSPARVEFLCAVRADNELKLRQAFIDEFALADEGSIPVADWQEAERFAKRFGHGIRSRKLGDCLMKAISKRLNCDIITFDRDFKERARRPESPTEAE